MGLAPEKSCGKQQPERSSAGGHHSHDAVVCRGQIGNVTRAYRVGVVFMAHWDILGQGGKAKRVE